jgi:hypothetical protein
MPLFKRRAEPRERKQGLFRRSPSPLGSPIENDNTTGRGGSLFRPSEDDRHDNHNVVQSGRSKTTKSKFFGRNTSATSSPSTSGGGGGLFGRRKSATRRKLGEDPTVQAARDKMDEAQIAERKAKEAHHHAQASVQAAKDHLDQLAREAKAEYVVLEYLDATADTDILSAQRLLKPSVSKPLESERR